MSREYWICTFGYGQEHAGYYVKVYGTYAEARAKMLRKYGSHWAFQYSAEEWQEWIDRKDRWIPLEKELEVIDD